MRIFLDANILFSAAKTDGAIRELLRMLLERGHECWADDYVATEARRNLTAKGAETLHVLDTLLARIHVARSTASDAAAPAADWLPAKDRPVLAAAIRLRCDALVTGDRTHFGVRYGKTCDGVQIHSPRSLAEAVIGRGK